jgi:hypothetical protein
MRGGGTDSKKNHITKNQRIDLDSPLDLESRKAGIPHAFTQSEPPGLLRRLVAKPVYSASQSSFHSGGILGRKSILKKSLQRF